MLCNFSSLCEVCHYPVIYQLKSPFYALVEKLKCSVHHWGFWTIYGKVLSNGHTFRLVQLLFWWINLPHDTDISSRLTEAWWKLILLTDWSLLLRLRDPIKRSTPPVFYLWHVPKTKKNFNTRLIIPLKRRVFRCSSFVPGRSCLWSWLKSRCRRVGTIQPALGKRCSLAGKIR